MTTISSRENESPAATDGSHGLISLCLATNKLRGLKKGMNLAGVDGATWRKWQKHLAHRDGPLPLSDLIAEGEDSPLLWGLTENLQSGEEGAVLRQLCQLLAGDTSNSKTSLAADLVRPWLAESTDRSPSAALGLESLAWCHLLPRLAATSEQPSWCELTAHLIQLAGDAATMSANDDPWAQQLLAGELPISLAYFLEEVTACRQLAKSGRQALSEGILELLDGEGVLSGQNWRLARTLLSCWTRAAALGRQSKKGAFSDEALAQFEWLVRQSLRFSRVDGSQMLTPDSAVNCLPLLNAVVELSDDAVDHVIANCVLPGRNAKGQSRRLPEAGCYSQWAQVALLRPDWSPLGERLAVNFADGSIQAELTSGRHVLFSGLCDPSLHIDGQPLEVVDPWQEVCWFTDDDVDYLELEADLTGGWRVQRQLLMAREDHFLFMADAILGQSPANIQYACTWPAPPQLSYRPEKETRECTIVGNNKPLAVVFPLALGEWRSDGWDHGEFRPTEDGLQLRQQTYGRGLYAPLFLDLKTSRLKRQRTWRQLTVGEGLHRPPPDVAVGYRVQVGNLQWLVYRSLADIASRTLLGQNFYNEFVLARFGRDGESESLIEIE